MIEKVDRMIIYIISYTSAFWVIYLVFPYIMPFIFGLIIALAAQRPIDYLVSRLKIKRGFASVIVVLISFLLIVIILVMIIVNIISELMSLSYLLPKTFDWVKIISNIIIDRVVIYLGRLDPDIVNSLKGSADKIVYGTVSAAVILLNYLAGIFKSLPGLLIMVLFTLISAIYIAKDLKKIKSCMLGFLPKEHSSSIRDILFEANKMLLGYMKAYLTIMAVTFLEILAGTLILRLRYALLISVLVAVFDILPVLGSGGILIPTSIIFFINKDYFHGFGILILYIIVSIVRQIIEPKIVSSSLGIHPLAIIIAFYVGLKAFGFTGMIYSLFLVVFYIILKRAGLFE